MTYRERLGLLEQFSDFSLQSETLFLTKIDEAKRLQIALRGPHRKQHCRLAPHRPGAKVHGQLNPESFVEARGQLEQPSCHRNPKGLAPELSSIFELDVCRNCSREIDARGSDFSS